MVKSLEPIPLDQAIEAKQLSAQLWITNDYTGTNPFQHTDNLTEINKTATQKQMAYSVSIDGKSSVYNKPLYDMARPIAPFSYSPYVEKRNVAVNGTTQQLAIEIYYPYEYEIKK